MPQFQQNRTCQSISGSGVISPDCVLPEFFERLKANLTFPLGWHPHISDVNVWKNTARAKAKELILYDAYTGDFDCKVLYKEDRGSYVFHAICFESGAGYSVPAYLLVPKTALAGKKCRGVVLYHDHGAKFDIGKEKCIRPIANSKKFASALEWVKKVFGGRFFGDELSCRGYVVLCADALGWGDRACSGYSYECQQALASNLLNLGSSYSAVIAQDDIRTAQFLSSLDFVDKANVASLGFSMGAFRAWQVSAIEDCVTACAASCWMAELKGLMVIGNNQVRGQSAFTMCHPMLCRYLDYPDVAGLSVPKPLMLITGKDDHLFPVASVKNAFKKIQSIYDGFHVSGAFSSFVMDGGHEFGIDRQEKTISWLEEVSDENI